jgi:hypothetical protein
MQIGIGTGMDFPTWLPDEGTPPPPGDGNILLESGDNLLLESGDNIQLE